MPADRNVQFSLHQIVVRDLPPLDLIRLAAELDCSHVCLFTQSAKSLVYYPAIEDQDIAEARLVMDDLGVSLLGATSFPITPAVDIGGYTAGLERAARLGGAIASVRFVDDDRSRTIENFGRFAELTKSFAMEACIEFTGFRKLDALDRAIDAIQSVGAGKLSLDALHIVRTGVSIERLQALEPSLFGYVQLCDGPLEATEEQYVREGGLDRLVPGEGEFPLKALIELTPNRPYSLEVPQEGALHAGVSPRERARRVVVGARDFIGKLVELSDKAMPTRPPHPR